MLQDRDRTISLYENMSLYGMLYIIYNCNVKIRQDFVSILFVFVIERI